MATKEEVLEIAKLARLEIGDSELDRFTGEFNAILDYVRKLEELELSTVEPMSHVHGATNVFRPDQANSALSTAAALRNAPELSDTSIVVPLIIDQENNN